MNECLFCSIVNKKSESKIIYEDDSLIVFMNKFPDAPGSLLLVPKCHLVDAKEMTDEIFVKFNEVIKKMISLLEEKMGAVGVKMVQNNGVLQEIKHYHIHIIPHYNIKVDMTNDEVYQILMEK